MKTALKKWLKEQQESLKVGSRVYVWVQPYANDEEDPQFCVSDYGPDESHKLTAKTNVSDLAVKMEKQYSKAYC